MLVPKFIKFYTNINKASSGKNSNFIQDRLQCSVRV